jgi:hypothetical protein
MPGSKAAQIGFHDIARAAMLDAIDAAAKNRR